MKIKDYILDTDIYKINEIEERYEILIPRDGKIIIAEDSYGNIKALANLRIILMIEPFVSENPIIGKKLWDYIEKILKEKDIKLIRCYANNKNARLFKKLGFYEVFENHIILEKNYYEVK